MRYWTLAAVATLTAFALFTLAGSLVARCAAALLRGRLDPHGPAARARLLFQMRMLPGLSAAIGAFGIALPIFLWFEADNTNEAIGLTLSVTAGAGAWLIAQAIWRASRAWHATRRVLTEWQRRSRPLDGFPAPLAAFAIDDPYPIVTVIGILRPRLFVAERVLRECTSAEVSAMVSHECAHVSARDNLKRLLIRACPDTLGVGRRLDRAWSAAAEEAADARAAAGDSSTRLDLADALIHVARLAAPQAPPLASAFYLGGSIDARVRRLVDPDVDAASSPWPWFAMPAAMAVVPALVVLAAPSLHGLMEIAVRLLP